MPSHCLDLQNNNGTHFSRAAVVTASTLVTTTKTGILRATERPKCSRVIDVGPVTALIINAAKCGKYPEKE